MSAPEPEALAWPGAADTFTLDATLHVPDPDAFRLLFGIDPSADRERPVAVTWTQVEHVSLAPPEPPRVPGWRARVTLVNLRARWTWRRAHAAWVAAGSPTRDVHHTVHLPSARLRIEEPTP